MGANCFAQTNALFRKNLVIQRRACKTNCCLICFPFLICLLLGAGQIAVTAFYLRSVGANGPKMDCGYCAASTNASFIKDTLGGLDCPSICPLPFAPISPPLLQLPPGNSEVGPDDSLSQSTNLQGSSIRRLASSAATFLVTGSNQSFAESVMSNMFPKLDLPNFTADMSTLADFALGTNAPRFESLGAEDLSSDIYGFGQLYFLQGSCMANSTLSFQVQEGSSNFTKAYDFTSSDFNKFNLIVSYNPIYKGPDHIPILLIPLPSILLRLPRLLNLVSNAYLQLRGNDTKMRFEFVKDMPRAAQPLPVPDISFILGKLPFVWIIMLLFPVILSNLVYEKQQKLRTMMKMHGLGDTSYWTITYWLKLFQLNNYRVQFMIYFAYINMQISFAFLMATFFSNVRTAAVTGYLFTIGSGFLGEYLFRPVFEDNALSRRWTTLMEFFPPFSLYRIIFEFSPPPSVVYRSDFSGIQWRDLSNKENGMIDILIIMALEWVSFLLLTLYLDEYGSLRKGIRKVAIGCRSCLEGRAQAAQGQTLQLQEFKASVETGSTDVFREREIVEQLLQESDSSYSVICDNLMKVYRGKDGNAAKIAVRRLSLYTQCGQCLGILGPNGAGKTSLIGMAVEQSLKSVRLFDGGVADKHVAKYSGGMKRRLSVAISLIGDPKVVYMDEPSSGLDPASRKALWNAVKAAKQSRAIMLTTHSMEEAEALCDRIAIMANGSLQCIGNSKELKAKYGGTYVLTVTAGEGDEEAVEQLVRSISPAVNRTYRISGTQKFEMPKQGVRISEVFQAMEHAKSWLNIHAWGLSDATLEDVFIKVVEESDISSV
ncbi:hypothetical protein EJB05_55419 [Eragrostis curvula]|uniref:ABC transporter domain-containing protein n=1 Tax=Eragrostis curvula TaxID=38414 RepID=A0A5J9SJV8_9POAL|nr:hypothetical protein EJB05_55419 [Eragrostis curvula]